eukprot:1160265-Pelagomonas_calceolata.AAC.6
MPHKTHPLENSHHSTKPGGFHVKLAVLADIPGEGLKVSPGANSTYLDESHVGLAVLADILGKTLEDKQVQTHTCVCVRVCALGEGGRREQGVGGMCST